MWNQNEYYYKNLKDILPRGGLSNNYLEDISPNFIRRFIGSYAFTNKENSSLAEYAYDSEKFCAQDSEFNHATFEFCKAKNHVLNGIRFIDENSHIMFGKHIVKKNNTYKNVYFIEGRIFTEFGLFQIYDGTICFYKIDDLIKYINESNQSSIVSNESLDKIRRSGLPTINDVPRIEVNADFELLFNVVCSIREGNIEFLNIFSEFSDVDMGMLKQNRSLR